MMSGRMGQCAFVALHAGLWLPRGPVCVSHVSSPFMGSALARTPSRSRGLLPMREQTSMVAANEKAQETVQREPKKKKKKSGGDGRSGARREKKGSVSKALAAALEKYEPIIGVEVHVQLATKTKAYCACSTKTVRIPNTNVCPVCMGHPGALPTLNRKMVELATKAAIALNCEVSRTSRFDRKNYYYVDTPKNYQITQQHEPIAERGFLNLATSGKRIAITRLHMEEDSAKMTHEGAEGASGRLSDSTHSLIDFNRSGIPLIEIVSEPDIRSGVEAAEYGQELQRILRYIQASDCNMQDGSMRLDVNVSIRPKGQDEFGTKVELKNLNSFSSVQKSIDYEIERQAGRLDESQKVVQETRTWDEKENVTKTMRVKEEAADYRYFPEPDLPPLVLEEEELGSWGTSLPELPSAKRERYEQVYGLSAYDAFLLADDSSVARYFESSIADGADAKQCANWIMGDITKVLKEEKLSIDECKLTPGELSSMVRLLEDGTMSGRIAKDLVAETVLSGGSPSKLVFERDLTNITDPTELRKIIEGVIDANEKEVAAYREGKTRLFGFFVGKVMAASGGRADPRVSNELLTERLGESTD